MLALTDTNYDGLKNNLKNSGTNNKWLSYRASMLCPNRMAFFKKFGLILKDYCLNSTLAGLSYIADSRW